MPEILQVEIPWVELDDRWDPSWRASFCLYAYLHPSREKILYIGKADYQTVRQRMHGDHKSVVFQYLATHQNCDDIRVLQGDLLLEPGRNRSSQLLSHVESLLIMRLQPPANVACTRSRAFRPGLRVRCTGQWPLKRSGFHDWLR